MNIAGDKVVEGTDAGIDTVSSTITFALIANFENLSLTGGASVDATGNGLSNLITGNSGANDLFGAGGRDTINGKGGDDTIVGQAGADILTGSTGLDDFVFQAASDSGLGATGTASPTSSRGRTTSC